MEMKDYYPRICDRILQNKLKITGAVLIVGAKWCGKTETALQSANSVLFIQESPQHKETAKMMPSPLLEEELHDSLMNGRMRLRYGMLYGILWIRGKNRDSSYLPARQLLVTK